jgi:sugar lactone lactonase YvrE
MAPPGPDLVRATEERYILAEGPTWDPVRGELLWVDVEAGLVMAGTLALDGYIAVRETLAMGCRVGAVAVAANGDWLIAAADHLYRRTPGGPCTVVRRMLPGGSGRRLNDGKPDPAGRFVVGTMPLVDGTSTTEELLLVEGDRVAVLDTDLMLSNGLAWSPGGRRMYSVDTFRRVVYRRPWDPATGTPGARATHLTFDDGYPDGICVDADGHLWVAMWGLGEVRRYAPDGTLVSTIPVPAPHTSSVAFAGPNLDVLVITSAKRDLVSDELARYPAAGALFTTRPGVGGLPQDPWSGIA